MRRMNITGLLVLLTLIRFYIPDLSAQTTYVTGRETLRGLKGFYVLIEELHDEIKQAGLTKSILRTDVELKFRKAGIRVLTRADALLTSGQPHLSVSVRVIIPLESRHGFVYSVLVAFKQDVILFRNRSIKTSGVTWRNSYMGINPNLQYVREVVGDLIDDFMNDYLAVNPK